MTTTEEMLKKVDAIEGWFDPHSGRKLYELARRSTGDIIEVGAWCGRTTCYMGLGFIDRGDTNLGKLIFTIDTWEGTPGEHDLKGRDLYGEWIANVQAIGVYPYVFPTKAASVDAAALFNEHEKDIQAGLLLIDADHSYEAVKQDFELWSPFVMPGGHIVFDDIPTFHGPTKLHRELPKEWQLVEYWANQAVFRRRA